MAPLSPVRPNTGAATHWMPAAASSVAKPCTRISASSAVRSGREIVSPSAPRVASSTWPGRQSASSQARQALPTAMRWDGRRAPIALGSWIPSVGGSSLHR